MTNLEFYGKGYIDKDEFFRLIDIYVEVEEIKERPVNNEFLSEFTNWLHSENTKQKRDNDQIVDRFMEHYSTKTNRYITWLKRGVLHNEMYVIGQIHGLQIGICDLSSDTLGYDCELFEDRVMFVTETTMEKFQLFKYTIINIYGADVFTFNEIELK